MDAEPEVPTDTAANSHTGEPDGNPRNHTDAPEADGTGDTAQASAPAGAPAENTDADTPQAESPEFVQPLAAEQADEPAAPNSPPPPLPSAMGQAHASRKRGPRPRTGDGVGHRSAAALRAAESFGRVDDDGNVFVTLPTGDEHFVGQWTTGDPSEGLRLYAMRYADLVVDVDLAGRRLADGKLAPDDARKTVERVRAALLDPKVVGDLANLADRVHQLELLIEVRRETLVEEQEAARASALERRQAIVAEAEELASSTAWRRTGDRYRELVDEWKAVPRVDRGLEQELWERFAAARAGFDKARRAHHVEQEKAHLAARQAKEKLIAEAEELSTKTDWKATAEAYRNLMDRWKKAGFAGKPADDALWRQFRAAQDVFFNARKAALSERDAEFEANLTRKQAIVGRAEKLLPVRDPKAARRQYRALLAEFGSIGYVPKAAKPKLDLRLTKVDEAIRSAEQEQWRKSDPERTARAQAMIQLYEDSVAALEKKLAAAQSAGDETEHIEADLASQREMLAAARKYG